MRGLRNALFLSFALAASPVLSAPPAAPAPRPVDSRAEKAPPVIVGPVQVEPYKLVRLRVANPPAGHFIFWDVLTRPETADSVQQRIKSEYEFVAPPGVYKVRCRMAKTPDTVPIDVFHTVTIGVPPAPGPTPDPKPVDPKPVDPPAPPVVKSFRVIFIWESGQTLTAAQNSVINGVVVSDFLNARTTRTDETRGWRIKDKDATFASDTPTFNELWKTVRDVLKPDAKLPAVAIEVNGKAEVVALDATPAAMVATFKKYLGEK